MKDICKGCSLKVLEFVKCAFVKANQEDICPCIECLVKPICRQTCEKRGMTKIKMYKLQNPYDKKGIEW